MKTLFIQLARFGDVFLTWPTIRAYRAQNPHDQIHFLVRKRFSLATEGLAGVDCHWHLDTANILEPILTQSEGGYDEAMLRLQHWAETLKGYQFDKIINLSFSPFSSYLTDFLANPDTEVRGYTRTRDGYLAIPDDTSAYFHAQVGTDRPNRYHLADIFAAVSGVDLAVEHWPTPNWTELEVPFKEYVVIHVATSQAHKSYPWESWRIAAREILNNSTVGVILVGSSEEAALGKAVAAGLQEERVVNWVGQTDFAKLFSLISGASLFLGGDSAPLHISSLTGTKALNLSLGQVNFWETGPRTVGSRVLVAREPKSLPGERVAQAALQILQDKGDTEAYAECVGNGPVAFMWRNAGDDNWTWRFLEALYTGTALPPIEERQVQTALEQMLDLVEIGRLQTESMRDPAKCAVAAQLLDQVELALKQISHLVPQVAPLERWFRTEKVRIGPGSIESLLSRTREIYVGMESILKSLLDTQEDNFESPGSQPSMEATILSLKASLPQIQTKARQTADLLRNLQTKAGGTAFLEVVDRSRLLANVLATLVRTQGLATSPEKMAAWRRAEGSLHKNVKDLLAAMTAQDYVLVADLLEYDLTQSLEDWGKIF